MSLKPDHTAADLRKLMDQFATAAHPATPAAQANRIRQQLSEMDYGGGRSPHAGMGLPRDDDDGNIVGKKEIMVKPETVKKTRKDVGDKLDQAFAQAYDDKGVKEGSAGWMLRQDPELAKKVRDNTQGYKDLKKMAGKPVPKKDEKGVAEHSMYGDEEVSWEKGGRRAPTGAFRNPAVVKTDKSIGTRVSDIGPGGKEYNVKTDKEWDKQKGVAEGRAGVDDTDTVGFSVNSEAAYRAVMARFGDAIDHDETDGIMYAPARLWPRIEMIAFDADGEGAVRDEGIAEVKHFKTSYGYAGGRKPSGGQYRHPDQTKADSVAKKTVQAQQKNKQSGVTEGNLAEDSIRPNLAAALKELGFKGPFKLGQLPKWMAELQLGPFGEDTSIMIGGDDPEYDPWVAKGYDYGYAYGIETGYQKGLSAREVLNNAKSDIQNLKDVAEAESEKSAMDTPAVQRAIAGMRQRHEKEPFDLEKARALGQKLAARNRDTRRK
jgi:hypothetical protein